MRFSSNGRLILFVPLVLGASSIVTLLSYLSGVIELKRSAWFILVPSIALLAAFTVFVKRQNNSKIYCRIIAGLWAGVLATFAYDLVRLPIAMSGVPVFKAISYFGTVILNQPSPTIYSEIIGWSYHLSNGVGFGLMYVCLVGKPRWWTAVAWGLFLECMMLLTPYAEVFGYRISQQFLAITISAHVVYGLTLWAALRPWHFKGEFGTVRLAPHILWIYLVVSTVGIAAIGSDFHVRYARKIPPSPPDYIGPHLYVTWDTLEPDRLVALWVTKRFVDPQARFHFQASFSRITRGMPFDTPDSTIRRTGTKSTTEMLLVQHGLESDAKLEILARMTHLYEITPWLIPSEKELHDLGQNLRQSTQPVNEDISAAAQRGLAWLDVWYSAP